MLAALLKWPQGTFVSKLDINKDKLQVADYGLVGDLFVLLPELTTKAKEILRNKSTHDTVKK
jgi:hypothetical protein